MAQRPRGFTIVELLTVIAIIGGIVALLLPAVQAARESARRASCVNHLKQLGLAIQNYAAARGTLPPGNITLTAGICHGDGVAGLDYPSEDGTNWMISILPFIEQVNFYQLYSFNVFNEDAANRAVRQTYVEMYVCPSDQETGAPQMPNSGPAGSNALQLTYMPGSYRAMTGRSDGIDFLDSGGSTGYQPIWRGAIHTIGIYGFRTECWRDITDGASKTLMAGESTTLTSPQYRTLWAYSYAYYSLSAATPQDRVRFGDFDQCVAAGGLGGQLPCERGWGSNHGDGQNFVRCDGSVTFLTNDLDSELFAELSTIAGNETVPDSP
jgi:prepilin-type N-terminal cleavage/methylation domain-containing protein